MQQQQPAEIPDEIVGVLGYAMQVDAADFKGPANLATWFLHIQNSMPWDSYVLTLIHLRDEPGLPPAVKDHKKSEYEIILAALDPHRTPDPQDPSSWSLMQPINGIVQLGDLNDDDARSLAFDIVRWCLEGRLWVDPPFSGDDWVKPIRHLVKDSLKGRI